MQRCLQLAELGKADVAPNPMVGSVIVHEDRIIGEGYHQRYGEAHAEVNAIQSVKNQNLLSESTLYVNLEPCAHHGKTPPCADLIIERQIPRVVICNHDPFDEVAGKGIERLRNAGIKVETGILEKEGRILNRRFFTFHEQKRAYVILKWAQTSDGYLDHYRTRSSAESALKITSMEMDQMVHRWRAEESAILIGKNTAILDNPALSARLWPGRNPQRVLVDPQLQVTSDFQILADGEPTLIFNALKSGSDGINEFVQMRRADRYAEEIAEGLYERGIQSVIIEGGSTTIQAFLDAGLWDEARVITGPQRIGNGVNAPQFASTERWSAQVGPDKLQVYFRA